MHVNEAGLILAYHGTSAGIAQRLISAQGGAHLHASQQDYDWLGTGIYFWENSVRRAMAWAGERHQREPAVIGAAVHLGHCLDLLDQEYIDLVRQAARRLSEERARQGKTLRPNRGKAHYFDRALIEDLKRRARERGRPFDSSRSAFMEGDRIDERSAFHTLNHIQVAVFNPNCIKGYFWPQLMSREAPALTHIE